MVEIQLSEVTHYFQRECILDKISCIIPAGKITTVLGRSGSGKSTLLNIIAGLECYNSGKITFNDSDQPYRERIGYMTQKDLLLPFKTVLENLMLITSLQKEPQSLSRKKILLLLSQFHLQDFANKYPRELSGGLRQRVHMIRQFLIQSPLLLLDEPFVALDIITKEHIQNSLKMHIQDSKKTTILVTHDIREALLFSHQVIILGGQPSRVVQVFTSSDLNNSKKSLEEEIVKILKIYYQ